PSSILPCFSQYNIQHVILLGGPNPLTETSRITSEYKKWENAHHVLHQPDPITVAIADHRPAELIKLLHPLVSLCF
uniref:Uncharacterized protein n=1 Tax=Aegilops tauschii subsp. strangulata TaxID=200361 RepID=A0A453QIH9_AEGTS